MSDSHKTKIDLAIIISAILMVVGIVWFFFFNDSFWHEGEGFNQLIHEKGHWGLELFIGAVEIAVIDVFVILLLWRIVIRPHIHKDLRHLEQTGELKHGD